MTQKQNSESAFVLVSHYPLDHDKGPCASVHAAMVADDATIELRGYVNVGAGDDLADVLESLLPSFSQGDCRLIFNGLVSLLKRRSEDVLEWAFEHDIPITVYWHETSWNLRALTTKTKGNNFAYARVMLSMLTVDHWVTTPAARHPISLLFGAALDQIRCVYEVAELKTFKLIEPTESADRSIVLGAAGVPVARKGVDRFMSLSDRMASLGGCPLEFHWYAATAENTAPRNAVAPRVKWMGHAKDFRNVIPSFDALLLTSRDDPFPLVALEALATGRPVFCFDTVGTAEVLPSEFVATTIEDFQTNIEHYWDHRSDWTPARFRQIAEDFSAERFRERALRALPDLDDHAEPPFSEIVMDPDDLIFQTITRLRTDLNTVRRSTHRQLDLQESVAELKRRRQRDGEILKRARTRLRQIGEKPSKRAHSVVVVGASPQLLETELGAHIDACDEVIRLNSFSTKGFERHVGSRTTHALISFACAPSEELSALPASKVHLYLPDGRSKRDARSRMLREDGCGLDPSDIDVLNKAEFCDGVMTLIDPRAGCWPTTGSAAIQWALDKYGSDAEIYVCGFSFYSETIGRGENDLTRYDGSVTKTDGKHDFDAERARFSRLILSGDIVSLTSEVSVDSIPMVQCEPTAMNPSGPDEVDFSELVIPEAVPPIFRDLLSDRLRRAAGWRVRRLRRRIAAAIRH